MSTEDNMPDTGEEDILQFICFKLADEEYAISVDFILEAIKVLPVTPLPQVPEFCLGVANFRGLILPVFDLRKKFLLDCAPFNRDTRILIANIDNMAVGFIIDRIIDHVKLKSSQVDPAPRVKMNIPRGYIQGLGEIGARTIIILNLKNVHDSIVAEISEHSLNQFNRGF
ncbi:MAG: chemotaxis protein CheW [Candidatus Omnitrophica bacterium]|nr:chemotaxis protein CheW [Candidatus Omnitrophota bacterium]